MVKSRLLYWQLIFQNWQMKSEELKKPEQTGFILM